MFALNADPVVLSPPGQRREEIYIVPLAGHFFPRNLSPLQIVDKCSERFEFSMDSIEKHFGTGMYTKKLPKVETRVESSASRMSVQMRIVVSDCVDRSVIVALEFTQSSFIWQ